MDAKYGFNRKVFWDWLCEFYQVHNGQFVSFSREMMEWSDIPEYVREMIKLFCAEGFCDEFLEVGW